MTPHKFNSAKHTKAGHTKAKYTKLATCVLLGLTVAACGGSSDAPKQEIAGATSLSDTGTGVLSGAVSLSDKKTFVAQTDTATKYGTFSLSESGDWTFKVNSSGADYISASAGQALTEAISITSANGKEYKITVTTTGKNDQPEFESGDGKDSASFDYSLAKEVTGVLPITDPDAEQSKFKVEAGIQGTFGALAITADGSWKYTIYNASVKKDGSAPKSTYTREGNTATETFTVSSVDGTTHDISVVIDNHIQYQQISSKERFAFGYANSAYNVSDLLDTNKLTAILAKYQNDIQTMSSYQYNESGDLTFMQEFSSPDTIRFTATYNYSQVGDLFTQVYTRSEPKDGSTKESKQTSIWNLDTKKYDSSESVTTYYRADGSVESTYTYGRDYTYTEQGTVLQKYSKKLINSDSGEYDTPYLSSDYLYDDTGDRLQRTDLGSDGLPNSVSVYDAGHVVSYKGYASDGETVTARYEQELSGGKVVKYIKYGNYQDPETGDITEQLTPLYVNFFYYDDFGRLDRVAKVYYLPSGEEDADKGVEVTQYIYNQELNVRLSYKYQKLPNVSGLGYYKMKDEPSGHMGVIITRYADVPCGTAEQLKHSLYAEQANTEACPAEVPFPTTAKVKASDVALSIVNNDKETVSFD